MKNIRVMWLLNHTTLRNFEIKMLNYLGINEIFTPKKFPFNEENLSADVVYTYDTTLTIPKSDLEILNDQDWYESPSQQAWDIANKYFDIVFLAFFPSQVACAIKYFKKQIVLKSFGLGGGMSYTSLLKHYLTPSAYAQTIKLGNNKVFFGVAYTHLKDREENLLKDRALFLPSGLDEILDNTLWKGNDKKIFFVCPRIQVSTCYNNIYRKFKENFKGLEYIISGVQPIKSEDPNVIGFVSKEIHEQNMQTFRVMFYHSTEPNHMHDHPFEAIKNGMPLIFMAGGLLDKLGGKTLPGRCKTIKEARKKIQRILNDDWKLIESIRKSQMILLEPIKFENCIDAWRIGLDKILSNLETTQLRDAEIKANTFVKKKRIGVIIPVGYRGGTLRGAKLVAEAIFLGSQKAGEEVEVILGHLDLPDLYSDEDFLDMPIEIKLRPYKWKIIDKTTAECSILYSKIECNLHNSYYQIPDDGINYFLDCDLLIIISDRLEHPLLPIRPYVLIVYDYLQRYENFLSQEINQKFINAAHNAEKIFVITEFTKQDALQFAKLPESKVVKLPILIPDYNRINLNKNKDISNPYFLWTTNTAIHKNHENAFKALKIYYEELSGKLKCFVSGVNTDTLLTSLCLELKSLPKILNSSPLFKKNFEILGEMSEYQYWNTLFNSEFLWHPSKIDNGTFSVIEAAFLGVPSLSSYYPAIREVDEQFYLNLMWIDAFNPMDMAQKLKKMEIEAGNRRLLLPSQKDLSNNLVENLSPQYWNIIKDCL